MRLDPLSDILAVMQPRTFVAGGFDLGGEWSIQFEPHAGLKCYAVLAGGGWLVVDEGGPPMALKEGDCIILPPGRRFQLTKDPTLLPEQLADLQRTGWRCGIATVKGGGETSIIGGHFDFGETEMEMLLGAVPPIAHLRGHEECESLRRALERTRRELVDARPGGLLVIRHLAHLILVEVLRLYIGDGVQTAGWLFALNNPRLARAVGAMHAEPGSRWTLHELAKLAGMSRSSFARTFKDAREMMAAANDLLLADWGHRLDATARCLIPGFDGALLAPAR
jgi:hypothetical protein